MSNKTASKHRWMTEPEFRCTRRDRYPHGTPDEAMQGHYIRAHSEEDALQEMRQMYPGETFGVRRWKEPGEIRTCKIVRVK